jgi:hypothetical protein
MEVGLECFFFLTLHVIGGVGVPLASDCSNPYAARSTKMLGTGHHMVNTLQCKREST